MESSINQTWRKGRDRNRSTHFANDRNSDLGTRYNEEVPCEVPNKKTLDEHRCFDGDNYPDPEGLMKAVLEYKQKSEDGNVCSQNDQGSKHPDPILSPNYIKHNGDNNISNQDLDQENRELKEKTKNLDQENRELKEKTKNLTRENRMLRQLKQDLDQENRELTEKIKNLTRENRMLRQLKQDLYQENGQLRLWTSHLQSKNEAMEKKTNHLQLKNEAMEKKMNDLQLKNKAMVKKTNDLQLKNEELDKKTNDLQLKNEALEKRTNDLQLKIESMEKKTNDLENEKSEIRQKIKCKVCLLSDVEVLLQPCRHLCCCASCAIRCQHCPVCRSAIKRKVDIFIS